MPTDEPEMLAALAAYNGRGRRPRTADRVATILLLVAHGFLVAQTVGVLSLLVMGTDSCGVQTCGDPAWVNRAMVVGLGGGAVVFVLTAVVAVRRLTRHLMAFFVPLAGCAAQVALAIAAAAMESLAGPV